MTVVWRQHESIRKVIVDHIRTILTRYTRGVDEQKILDRQYTTLHITD